MTDYLITAYQKSGFSYEDEIIQILDKQFAYAFGIVNKITKKIPFDSAQGDCDFITWLGGDGFGEEWNIFIFWQAKRLQEKEIVLEKIGDSFTDKGTYPKGKISPKNDTRDFFKAINQISGFNPDQSELAQIFDNHSRLPSIISKRINVVITEAKISQIPSGEEVSEKIMKIGRPTQDHGLFLLNGKKNTKHMLHKAIWIYN